MGPRVELEGAVRGPVTPLTEVVRVLRALDDAACRYWLEGGWGVDALVGHPTRPHRDVDLDLHSEDEATALQVLDDLGYVVETDWRPNRVELVAAGRGWVDVHPLLVSEDGTVRQAALGGGFHEFPRSCFTVGALAGITVPCVTAETQRLFRQGYDLRPVDRHDLNVLSRLVRGGD